MPLPATHRRRYKDPQHDAQCHRGHHQEVSRKHRDQVQFYAATNWDRDIKAVVLLGAFANLPWKSRNILVQDEERYQQLAEASMKSLRDGTLDQILPVKMRFATAVSSAAAEAPITGQHFLTYRWEQTSV